MQVGPELFGVVFVNGVEGSEGLWDGRRYLAPNWGEKRRLMGVRKGGAT